MTSRGDEYIKEMNPNVPFQFDIHFKIFSEDALETLQNLHQRFDDKRVNTANSRRDFFQVSID
ncbi:MAG: GIY-YIG nuclease family protein [Nostoc sp.]|uniref:GIY-YIG nuclease family protein n=1 Tax=Nostoc sp. TaxID=1180 RepID=UPI002FF169D7